MKEELEKLIKENFYDDHENCDDSCGKKADYTELITSIINLVDKEVIGEDYPKDYPYDDPEAIKYFNIEKERQRAKLKGVIRL